jgi:hypothetical protein
MHSVRKEIIQELSFGITQNNSPMQKLLLLKNQQNYISIILILEKQINSISPIFIFISTNKTMK